jgi:L-iditol 2-dehydrogenase
MQAAVWRGGAEVSLETLPVPEVGVGELLVQVEACGLCPTDIKKIDLGLVEPPVVFGHEMVGEVVAAGEGAEAFTGKRVGVYHHVPCRQCRLCALGLYSQCTAYKKTGTTAGFSPAGGGWAEYVKVLPWIPAGGGVVEIPRSLPIEIAVLMEPLNTCLKCLQSVPEPVGTLVVLGQGPVGLMLTVLAKSQGWDVLAVEPLPERREKASRFGVREVIGADGDLAARLRELAGPLGPDAAIAATEAEEAITGTLRALRPGGRLVLFAHTRRGQEIRVDAGEVGVSEKQLTGSYSSSVELNLAVRQILLDDRYPWGEFVTHLFPLEHMNLALGLARHPKGGSLKVAVVPDSASAPGGGGKG